MFFDTKLTVTINGKIINTVHSVKTKYDSKHIGSTCDIVVPLNSQISYKDGSHDFLPSYVLSDFAVGDPVNITAEYPITGFGPVTIFNGTLFEFKEGTPCTIKCIDYLPLLGHIGNWNWKSVTLQTVVNTILQGTGITPILPMPSMTFVNLTFRLCSPWAALTYIKKNLGLNIALMGNQLYVNVASNTLRKLIYRSDTNIYQCDLQQPDTIWQGFKVKAWFLQPSGERDSLEVGDSDGHLTEVYFYNVSGGLPVYTKLANQALIKIRQRKFSGTVHGYLYPDCQLFDQIQYTDIRYPDRSGNYVLTELSHDISDKGFHRIMTWAFLQDVLNTPNTNG
jgi:hypothetical protein